MVQVNITNRERIYLNDNGERINNLREKKVIAPPDFIETSSNEGLAGEAGEIKKSEE